MASQEKQCPLGYGECPPICNNYKDAPEKGGEEPQDPFMIRLGLIFADAFDSTLNVTHISAVMGRCIKKKSIPQIDE